jgi:hypothetical protein
MRQKEMGCEQPGCMKFDQVTLALDGMLGLLA